VVFLDHCQINSISCLCDDVLDCFQFDVFFIDLSFIDNDWLTLWLLRSLGGLGFCLGNRCDDKPLTWADFKPLSSREDLKGFRCEIMPHFELVA